MNNAFVIGHGVVGKATCRSLKIHHYIDIKGSNIDLKEASKKLFCFICLPTPTDNYGQQGIDEIWDYIRQIKELGNRNIFVIRSTVLPGTCKRLAEEFSVMVASNPEFLSEDTWEQDAINPKLIVIGADDDAKEALVALWKPVKSKIRIVTDTITAETLKYALNAFSMTKIVWANQIYDACKANGADYETIREMLYQHPWGSKHHLEVFHKGGRGGGGKCFPKDLHAFTACSDSELLRVVRKLNTKYLVESKK